MSNSRDDALDALATPVLRVVGERIDYLNPAAASWFGSGLRRLQKQSLSTIDPEGSLQSLAARATEARGSLRAQRLTLGVAGTDVRFAHALVSVDSEDAVWLELHPVDEFSGDDPATMLPAALGVALKGLAHEVKNPLAGLKGAAQLLKRRITDPDAERYIDVILGETERLLTLVQRLLEPPSQHPFCPTNVHSVLERVRLLAEAEAGWAIRIERDYDPSLPEVPADADRLTQALINLVRNALQAEPSVVKLRTRAENSVVIGDRAHRLALRIEVIDDGRGVPDELAERVFLPLVSGRAQGSGLGLALAQQVAREHSGSLSYRSRRGHTVFTLLLPAAREETG